MKNCLILGSGRSGTSLTAGMLQRSGYYCGSNLLEPRDANPAGFYEDHLVNYTNELILHETFRVSRLAPGLRRLLGRPPHIAGQLWLTALDEPVDWEPIPPAPWIMSELAARAPFAYKDPRFSYTLNAWRPYIGDCRFVCLFRHPATVAESMVNDVASEPYYANLSLDSRQALKIWIAMYQQILDFHCTDRSNWLFIEYGQLLSGQAIQPLGRFLDTAVDTELLDSRLNRSAAAGDVPIAAERAYSRLIDIASDTQAAAMAEQ